jgi:hypothetical protein
MSTRNLPVGKVLLARKADNLTAICEPVVYKMWEPRRITALQASLFQRWLSFFFFFTFYPEDERKNHSEALVTVNRVMLLYTPINSTLYSYYRRNLKFLSLFKTFTPRKDTNLIKVTRSSEVTPKMESLHIFLPLFPWRMWFGRRQWSKTGYRYLYDASFRHHGVHIAKELLRKI